LESDLEDFNFLLEESKKIKQEQAQLMFSVADYIVYKTAQVDGDEFWLKANEIRRMFTEEKLGNVGTLANQQLDSTLLLQYMIERKETGIDYKAFLKSRNLI
jgi:hypothetical protein